MGKRLRHFTGRAKFRQGWQARKGTNSKIAPTLICMCVCVCITLILREEIRLEAHGCRLAASALAIETVRAH
jgi:hypothetical protein